MKNIFKSKVTTDTLLGKLNIPTKGKIFTKAGKIGAFFNHPIPKGISFILTAYEAYQEGKNITSIEGCPKTIEVAKVYLNEGGLCNYAILEGSFTSVLKDLSKTKKTYDLIYIDGHHTAEALLDLIPMCQSLLNEKGVIAVDDIFWNYAVHKAWRKSIERTKPWASFEFLNFGYMFFDTKGLNQQFFKLW